jgi:uncharacterized damage-inducible protein DinB
MIKNVCFNDPGCPIELPGSRHKFTSFGKFISMNRFTILFVFAALAAPVLQAENPVLTDTRASYEYVRTNILKAAEKMPEAEYSFKPSADVRTFGELIAHVADAQTGICGLAKEGYKRGDAASKTSKAELIAALKASNNACDDAYNSIKETQLNEIVKTPLGEKPRLGVLTFNVAHDNESYGTIVVYLRLKGIVPPSSEK